VCAQLHFNTCTGIGIQLKNDQWYEHVPKSVKTSRESTEIVLWNQMQTDRAILNNTQDIIISDNERVTCTLIDARISGERNVIKKAEKILKYKDLTTETQRMFNVQAKVIPLIKRGN